MKNNAPLRIAIWSMVLLLLVVFLLAGLGIDSRTFRQWGRKDDTAATQPTEEVFCTGTVAEAAYVYRSPSLDSTRLHAVKAGQIVEVLRVEIVGGDEWLLLKDPGQGQKMAWIQSRYVQLDEDLPKVDFGTTFTGEAATRATDPEDDAPLSGTATAIVNVRKSPSLESERVGTLEFGQAVTIIQREAVGGQEWALITEPMNGWIVMDGVKLDEATPTESPSEEAPIPESFVPGGSVPAKQVSAIRIDWVGGNITVEPAGGDEIVFLEEDSDNPMVWQVKGTALEIQFSEKTDPFSGWRLFRKPDKDLTIQVPRDWTCKELDLDAASAKLFVRDMTIGEVDLDTASGTSTFENCQVEELNVDTASGDVVFSGTLNAVDYDAASADLTAVLTNVPRSINVDSASGSLDLTLPEGAGYSLKMDTMSGRHNSDFPTQRQNGRDVCGDGACKIDMDAMSGSVTIRKAAAQNSLPCTDPSCTDPNHGHTCTVPNCTDPSHDHSALCTLPDCTDPDHDHNALCTVPDCTDPNHDRTCTVPNCTDPNHDHTCTVPNCTDPSHGHNGHEGNHR